ncbi:hypothetical protein [Hydrogenimonas sp.]
MKDVVKAKSNILHFAPFGLWGANYVRDIEVAQTILEKGNHVTWVYCDGTLPSCEPNPLHNKFICEMCKSIQKKGMDWLKKKNRNIKFIPIAITQKDYKSSIDRLENLDTVEKVRNFVNDGIDIGRAAYSSTVSYYREPRLEQKHFALLFRHLQTAYLVYEKFTTMIPVKNFDAIVIFNGRLSTVRPLLRLAKSMEIPVLVHEVGQDIKHYSITYNTYPHDLKNIHKEIFELVLSYNENMLNEGKLWFENRIKPSSHRFIKHQKEKFLPYNWSDEDFNLVVFISSEDEFVAIEEWQNPYYADQNEGLRKLLEDLKDKNIKVYLRVHPNLSSVLNSQTKAIKELDDQYGFLTVIGPDDKVDTYELAKKASIVLTFGSTVGIESAFLGTPSITMGQSPYTVLGSTILPINHEQMIEIILEYKKNGKLPITTKLYPLLGYYYLHKDDENTYMYMKYAGEKDAVLFYNGKKTDLKSSVGFLFFKLLYRMDKLKNYTIGALIDFTKKELKSG